MQVRFEVNGHDVEVAVEPRLTLADCLRHHLRLTGTHVGCEHGVCGACTVLVDGKAVRSCLILAVQAEGSKVVTVEGLSKDEGLTPLQASFRKHHALQCGVCTPGMITTAQAPLGCVACSRHNSAAGPGMSRSSRSCSMRAPPIRMVHGEEDVDRHVDGAARGPALPARPRRICR